MEFKDEKSIKEWDQIVKMNSNTKKDPSGYGLGIIHYAEAWADLMEVGMARGQKLEDVAEKASHDADTEKITGCMYGMAVSILAKHWKYGEQLRRWHNKDCQLNDEGDRANESGGVLNPAMITVKGRS